MTYEGLVWELKNFVPVEELELHTGSPFLPLTSDIIRRRFVLKVSV